MTETKITYFDAHTHHVYDADSDVLGVFQWMAHESFLEDFGRFFSVGIHPWFIQQWQLEQDLDFVRSCSQRSECLAIGECGLDALVATPMKVQSQIFEAHIDLALELQKPLVIHCVRAFTELFAILDKRERLPRIMIHGFNKNEETAMACIDRGFYLSFGADLLAFGHLQKTFQKVPTDRILLESDQKIQIIADVYHMAQSKRPTDQMIELVQQNFNQFYFG